LPRPKRLRQIPRGFEGEQGCVNKWWVRFWGFVALASLAALIVTTIGNR
jgi:hypothetical protein